MTVPQTVRAERLSRLLRSGTEDYSISPAFLTYYSSADLDQMIHYVEKTPRVTAYGRILSRQEAIKIVGSSLQDGSDVQTAMRLDTTCAVQWMEILGRCITCYSADASPEQSTRIAAVLFAVEKAFLSISFPEDAESDIFQTLMNLIYRNPREVTRLMERTIGSEALDAELASLLESAAREAQDGSLS